MIPKKQAMHGDLLASLSAFQEQSSPQLLRFIFLVSLFGAVLAQSIPGRGNRGKGLTPGVGGGREAAKGACGGGRAPAGGGDGGAAAELEDPPSAGGGMAAMEGGLESGMRGERGSFRRSRCTSITSRCSPSASHDITYVGRLQPFQQQHWHRRANTKYCAEPHLATILSPGIPTRLSPVLHGMSNTNPGRSTPLAMVL